MTVDYVLANPPFGKKSSMSFINEEGEQETDDLTYNRQDFWATTSNKQLNFAQHIRTKPMRAQFTRAHIAATFSTSLCKLEITPCLKLDLVDDEYS